MAHDVFISYSDKDKTIADAVCSSLESKGIRCWIAPRNVLPGRDWGESIIDAITESRALVLLLSSHSNISPQVRREVERAINKEIAIIPMRLEDMTLSKSLEYYLSTTHWLDAVTRPMEKHLYNLADKVRQVIALPQGMDGITYAEPPKRNTTPPAAAPIRKNTTSTSQFSSRVGLTIQYIGDIEANYTYFGIPIRDVQFDVFLDNQYLGTGSRNRGFTFTVETTIGEHVLSLSPQKKPLLGAATKLSYNLEFSTSGKYEAVFERTLTGKFKVKLRNERA